MKTRKGIPKKPIPSDCIFCDYKGTHRPGLAKHIQGAHPEKWRGNLGSTLGGLPSRKWKHQPWVKQRKTQLAKQLKAADKARERVSTYSDEKRADLEAHTIETDVERERRLRRRRIQQRRLRARYYRQGRNSHGQLMPPGWKPRKMRRQVRFDGGRAFEAIHRECPICHRPFATRKYMGQHLQKAHGKFLSDFCDLRKHEDKASKENKLELTKQEISRPINQGAEPVQETALLVFALLRLRKDVDSSIEKFQTVNTPIIGSETIEKWHVA